MGKKDPRVTAYVQGAPAFARPILGHLRAAVHAGCPEVEETVKWGMPSFVHQGLLGGMAHFKAHCALWLWRGRHVPGLGAGKPGAMGQFGRLTSLTDLPPRAELVKLIRAAARLNESLAEAPRPRRARSVPARASRRGGAQAASLRGKRTA